MTGAATFAPHRVPRLLAARRAGAAWCPARAAWCPARAAWTTLAALLVLLAALVGAPAAHAQPARESAVKAAFLYKFGTFVEWPPGTFARAEQPLVIGVSADDEVAADLEQLTAGRTVEGRPIAVRRFGESGPFTGAHILFLGNRRESRLRDTLEAVPGAVLVVTDQPGGLRTGSVLNFMADAGRVRFSASLLAAEARHLKLSSQLLAVAQHVEGRR